MKVIICASMRFCKEMVAARDELVGLGHEVVLPMYTEEYAKDSVIQTRTESAEEKIKDDLIKGYFEKIKQGDTILVLNYEKEGVENYVGGNTFIEIAFAHVLEKKIYLLNDIPKISYADEIVAMQPIILNGDLSKIA